MSVNMVVCNEAHRIEATLAGLRPFVEEIVVAVQKSDDDTLGLVRGWADRVLRHPRYGRCEPSRRDCADASRFDWVLVVDADERVSDRGWDAIANAIEAGVDVWYLMIENWVGGRFVQTDLMACPRLFRRGKVSFATHLHGLITPTPEARCQSLLEPVVLVHEKSVEEQQADWDRYSTIEGRPRGTWTDESRYG